MAQAATVGSVLRDRSVAFLEPYPLLLGLLALLNGLFLVFQPSPALEFGDRAAANVVYILGFVVAALCLITFSRLRGFGTALALGILIGMIPAFLGETLSPAKVYGRESIPAIPFVVKYLVFFATLATSVLVLIARKRVGLGRKELSPLLMGGLVAGAVEAVAIVLPDLTGPSADLFQIAGGPSVFDNWWLAVAVVLVLLVPSLSCTLRPLSIGIGIASGFVLTRVAELAGIAWGVAAPEAVPALGLFFHDVALFMFVVWILLMAARSRAPQEVADEP